MLFYRVIENAVVTDPQPYKDLIAEIYWVMTTDMTAAAKTTNAPASVFRVALGGGLASGQQRTTPLRPP